MCTSGVVGFNHWSGGSFFHGYPSCGWKRVAGRGDVAVEVSLQRWRIQHLFGYGSIPINTNFRGMNIHLTAILMFTRGTRFWHTAICCSKIQAGCDDELSDKSFFFGGLFIIFIGFLMECDSLMEWYPTRYFTSTICRPWRCISEAISKPTRARGQCAQWVVDEG